MWLFATCYWFLPKIGGKTFFTGPPSEHASDAEVEQVHVQMLAGKAGRQTRSFKREDGSGNDEIVSASPSSEIK